MKKLNKLEESRFLLLFFAFVIGVFLIGAVCMPDRGQMFSGLWQIVSGPSKISTNYFAVGGVSATLLNMALVCAIFLAAFLLLGAKANNVTNLGFLLTLGFSSWGINVLNIWFPMLGVALYCLVRKEKLSANANALLYSTGIAPLITELMVRYLTPETVGFTPAGVLLALVVGLFIGFILPAGLAFSPKVHQGFDLYSAAVPIGMTAFLLQGVLYKTMGVALPAAPDAETLKIAAPVAVNVFCCILFGLCVVLALAMGTSPKAYWQMIGGKKFVANISATAGNGLFLMNVGVYGLVILAYYNLVGGTMNAITFGIIFCMLACCDSGSNPVTVLPIMLGYWLSSLVFGWFSGLVGGTFACAVNAQAILVGLCFANGLSTFSGRYGLGYGFAAAVLHYLLVTTVPNLHGGYCLYNGGFTAAFVCILLLPILERFCKTREERANARV